EQQCEQCSSREHDLEQDIRSRLLSQAPEIRNDLPDPRTHALLPSSFIPAHIEGTVFGLHLHFRRASSESTPVCNRVAGRSLTDPHPGRQVRRCRGRIGALTYNSLNIHDFQPTCPARYEQREASRGRTTQALHTDLQMPYSTRWRAPIAPAARDGRVSEECPAPKYNGACGIVSNGEPRAATRSHGSTHYTRDCRRRVPRNRRRVGRLVCDPGLRARRVRAIWLRRRAYVCLHLFRRRRDRGRRRRGCRRRHSDLPPGPRSLRRPLANADCLAVAGANAANPSQVAGPRLAPVPSLAWRVPDRVSGRVL